MALLEHHGQFGLGGEIVSLGLLFLRLIAGGIFAAHGYGKLFGGPGKPVHPLAARHLGAGFVQSVQNGPAGFVETLRRLEVQEPETVATFVGGAEFFGGLSLMLGLFTRLAALLLSGDMAVAISKVHWRNGLIAQGGYEFPLSMLGACLALLFGGAGKLSLDRMLGPW